MNKIITQINNSIFAVKAENTIQLMYEQELELKIANIFHQMLKEVLINLEEFYSEEIMFNVHMDLILSPIHEAHKEYFELIMEYKNREYNRGLAQAKRLVRRARNQYYTKTGAIKASIDLPLSANLDKGKLFGTDDFSAEYMANKTFVASERTLERVDSDINKIITEGYRDGKGINDVGQRIEKRFNQLKDWESRRIARTEIHGSHMQGIMQGYQDMDVQYTQWSTAHDSRVRGTNPADKADHVKMDGEIIPMGGVYSNGLKYPGDTDGPLREFINCRCGNLPFIMPPGYAAPPGRSHFRESDLVKVEDVNIEDKLLPDAQASVQNITKEPIEQLTEEEIKKRISQMDLEDRYELLDKVLSNEQMNKWIKLTDKLESFDNKIAKAVQNNNQKAIEGFTKARQKTVDLMYEYERLIYIKPKEVPQIDQTLYLLDNQEVGGAHSIRETVLEKLQIDLQSKVNYALEERVAVGAYGGAGHYKINGYIRDVDKLIKELSEELSPKEIEKYIDDIPPVIKNLNKAMDKTPGLNQKTQLFRAGRLDNTLRAGDTSSFEGFTSTSFQTDGMNQYKEEGRYAITMLADEGQKGIALNGKHGWSSWTQEHEWLLPNGQKFEVVEIDHDAKTAVIHLIN